MHLSYCYTIDEKTSVSDLPDNAKSSSKLCKRQLIRQAQRQLRMLQHVIEVQILEFILRGMDLLVRIVKFRFDDEA